MKITWFNNLSISAKIILIPIISILVLFFCELFYLYPLTNTTENIANLKTILITFFIVVSLTLFLISLVVKASIVSNLNKIIDTVQKSYTQSSAENLVTVESNDELKKLADEYNIILNYLKQYSQLYDIISKKNLESGGNLLNKENTETSGNKTEKEIQLIKQAIMETCENEEILHKNNIIIAVNLSEYFEVIRKITDNDLTIVADEVTGDDMFNNLGKYTNNMITNLKELIFRAALTTKQVSEYSTQLSKQAESISNATFQVVQSVNNVAIGAYDQTKSIDEASKNINNLVKSVEQIAEGAKQQEKIIELVSSSINQMSKAIENILNDANDLSRSSLQTQNTSRKGKEIVDKTQVWMEKIKESVNSFSERIVELNKSFLQIRKIIEVIEDIANQTNLLSLNAAIEAARAGEAGKGFAVVASEIRKLAERSSKSTKEIANLIGNINKESDDVVKSMGSVTYEVEEKTKFIKDTIFAFDEISKAVGDTDKQIQSISAAIHEISASSDEVVKSIENVASIVEQNTSSTVEMLEFSRQVNKEILNIASVSEENSASTEEVATSIDEQSAVNKEMSTIAVSLEVIVQELNKQIGLFKLQ